MFVGGLSKQSTTENIAKALESKYKSKVVSVDVKRDAQGTSRGFAFVVFAAPVKLRVGGEFFRLDQRRVQVLHAESLEERRRLVQPPVVVASSSSSPAASSTTAAEQIQDAAEASPTTPRQPQPQLHPQPPTTAAASEMAMPMVPEGYAVVPGHAWGLPFDVLVPWNHFVPMMPAPHMAASMGTGYESMGMGMGVGMMVPGYAHPHGVAMSTQ